MKLMNIFLIGVIVLIGALLLNWLAITLSLITWYKFLQEPFQAGIIDYIWLLLVYPLSLGVVAYFATSKIK